MFDMTCDLCGRAIHGEFERHASLVGHPGCIAGTVRLGRSKTEREADNLSDKILARLGRR